MDGFPLPPRASLSDPDRLAALHRYDVLGPPGEAAFDRVARLASLLLDAPMAGVHFIDDRCQWAAAQVGLDAPQVDVDVSFCAWELDTDALLLVEDATDDPRFRDNPGVTGEPGIRFYAGAPISTPEGYVLGRLCVLDTAPRPEGLSERERATLQQLAGIVMDELDYRAQPRHREQILESITDAFYALDTEWRFTYVNQQAEALLKHSRDELLGESIWAMFPETRQLPNYDAYHRAVDTGEPVHFQAYSDRFEAWFDVKAYPFEGGLSVYFSDITAEREQEETLQESQMLLETAQRIAHLGHWDWDVETGTITWSDETYRIFGYAPGAIEPTVETYFEAIPEPDRTRSRALARQALDTGSIDPDARRVEHRIVRPDGTERVVELEAQIVETNAAGHPTRLLGTVLDITRRRQREDRLRIMSRAVEKANESVVITGPALDPPGPRIQYVNPAFEAMTGYTAEEVIGKTPRILQGPETDRSTLDAVRTRLEAGEPVTQTTTINYRKDGTPFWVEWNITPVHGEDGAIEHWVSVQRDVTARRQREEALRAERNLLERIFDASASAITVLDTDGQIMRANGRAEAVLGLAPSSVKGLSYDDPAWRIEAVDGGSFPPEELPFARVMATEAPVYDVQHAIAWPDGQRRVLSINGAPLRDTAGRITGAVFNITDITEQHERETALQTEQQRLEMALVGGKLGMWDLNFNEGRNIVDARWARMLGYTLDEVGDDLSFFEDHVHPDDLERVHAAMERHARGEIPYVDLEIRMRHKDGSWRWILDRGKILEWNDDGSPRRAVGTHMDITERKQAEQALAEREALLRSINNHITEGIYRSTPDQNLVYVNEAFVTLFGYDDRAALLNLDDPATLYAHPEQREELIQTLRQDGAFEGKEVKFRRKDGSTFWGLLSGRTVFDEDGRVRYRDGAVLDITERKRAEEELRRQRDLLRQTQRLAGAWEYDVERGMINWSEEVYRILEWPPDRPARYGEMGDLFPPDARATLRAAVQTAIEEGTPYDLELPVVTKAGTERWVRTVGAPIRRDGNVVKLAGALQDITERKQTEKALIQARDEAEAMSRLKSAFLANMSHEIRTPLTAIIGFTDVLQGELEGPNAELLAMIRESGKRLEETLTSVLDLSELESNSIAVQPQPLDLAQAVREALHLFRPDANAKGLRLEADVPSEPVTATLDPGAVHRILSNLLSNAVKFTDRGAVRVRLHAGADQATIAVEDTGIGIDPDQVERIFQAFTQESEGYTRAYEGVGLGLHITKRLVDLVGGQIAVESTKGQGSTFTVHLPYDMEAPVRAGAFETPSAEDVDAGPTDEDEPPAGSATPPAAEAPAAVPSGAVSGRPEAAPPPSPAPAGSEDAARLLLVEDNDLSRDLLPTMLGEIAPQYAVDAAATPQEALTMAEATRYDGFIIDINLGAAMNGIDLLRALRERPEYAAAPMMACTAYALPGDDREFLEAGFDTYLAKPFRAPDLLEALQRMFGQRAPSP